MIYRARSVAYITMVLLIINMTKVIAQYHNSPTPFDAYYYDYKLANPALVGIKNEHVITTMESVVLANLRVHREHFTVPTNKI